MISSDETVRQAGTDLVAFVKGDAPAAGLQAFVETYFPKLVPRPIEGDLAVTNSAGHVLFIRRDEVTGHRGWSSLAGSMKFRSSEVR